MEASARRINVRGIIIHEGRLLGCKFHDDTKPSGETNFWGTPGGGLDPHESLVNGLAREIIEETGITPVIGPLLFIQQFKSERPSFSEELEFFFLIENGADFKTFNLAQTSHGANELTRCEFVNPATEVVLPQFLKTYDLAAAQKLIQPVMILDNFN